MISRRQTSPSQVMYISESGRRQTQTIISFLSISTHLSFNWRSWAVQSLPLPVIWSFGMGKALNPAHESTTPVTSCTPAKSVCNVLVRDRQYIGWTKERGTGNDSTFLGRCGLISHLAVLEASRTTARRRSTSDLGVELCSPIQS
jgi:hypothetical protein